MRSAGFRLIALLGLLIMPVTGSLASILLVRDAMTGAHIRAVDAEHASHHDHDDHHPIGHAESHFHSHSHKHRHSPADTEHEHQRIDPSLLAMLNASHEGGPLASGSLTFHAHHGRPRTVSHDQVPPTLTFKSPLRPPIA